MSSGIDRRGFIRGAAASAGAVATLSAGGRLDAATSNGAATVYANGWILTMEGDAPQYAEAVAVKDDRIAFVGSLAEALAAFPGAAEVDLAGRTMLPGFIDSWGHFALFAQQTLGVNLAYFSARPPRNRADVLARLKAAALFNGWIIGYGYDAPLLSDGPLTLADLDQAFPATPVMISTLSTLTGQVNSAGIATLGLTPQTVAAQPGQIVKDKEGRLTGELLFTPFLEAHAAAIGKPSQEVVLKSLQAGEALLAAQGYTTVQSYQLQPSELASFRAAFDRGLLRLDVIGMPSVSDAASGQFVMQADWTWGAYSHGDHGLKIPGYQVATDAAPQLRLAAFTQPYLDTTRFPDGWKGVLFPQATVEQWIGHAYANDIQLFCYSNGDAGIDLSLAAIEKAIAATGKADDRRTVIAHSYFVRADQLRSYARLNLGISMMPPHMMLYGDQLMTLLGPARATMESPMASALAAGLRTTMHCDCPSASPNVMQAVGTAVTRQTLSGQVLGETERVSPYAALLGVTRNVAFTYREEASKGTITAGKIADLVVLNANPLTVPPEQIQSIKVAQTIKRGQTVYEVDL